MGWNRDAAIDRPAGTRGGAEVGWAGGLAAAARRLVTAGQFVPQPSVLALELGDLPVQVASGGAQLLAAGTSRPRRARRGSRQQANDNAERGRHRQQQALAVAADRVVQDRDVASGGVLQHQIAHHHAPEDRHQQQQRGYGNLLRSRFARPIRAGSSLQDQNDRDRVWRARECPRDAARTAGHGCTDEQWGDVDGEPRSVGDGGSAMGEPSGTSDTRTSGVAATCRLGVGLGGDRRIYQPLPRTNIPQQAGGRRPDRQDARAS
jgi:hypothetical protein